MTATVIVGGSVAGVRTAQALRNAGHTGRLTLVTEEDEYPYDKPPLSKEFLQGAKDAEEIRLLTEQSAQDLGIDLSLGTRAVGIDVGRNAIRTATGGTLAYDTAVIATGAHARPSPWGQGPHVHTLRTLQDSQALRADLLRGGSVVVVGAGFIGSEIASTSRLLGLDVTMVDPQPVPMARVFNREVGQWFTDLHRQHGVETIFGLGVESISDHAGRPRVRLSDGRQLRADTVVVGVGAVPNDSWLEPSGLLVDNGLVCNEYCRAVNADNVYAVGDVARWFHRSLDSEVRAEHWTNAVEQALCVAHNIVNPESPRAYEPTSYIWSDQYDWKVQVVGRTGEGLRHISIGTPGAGRRFAVLYSDDGGTLAGAATVNWPVGLVHCRRELAAGRPGSGIAAVKAKLDAILRP